MRSLFISLALLIVLVNGTPSSFYRYCSRNNESHEGHGPEGAGHGHGHGHHDGHPWGHGGEHHWGQHGGQSWGHWAPTQHEEKLQPPHPSALKPVVLTTDAPHLSEPKSAQMVPTSQTKPQHNLDTAHHEQKQNPHFCHVPDLVLGKGKLVVSNPQLFPLVVMGIFIGMVLLLLTTKTIRLPHGAPISYASIFFFFTVMNVSALLYFCMLPSAKSYTASLISLFSEGFATSSIGLSLFIAALTDAGITKDCSLFKLAFTIIGYLLILTGWVQSVFFLLFWPHSVRMLYFGIPIAGFLCYYLVQTVWLIRSQTRSGAAFLIISFLAFVSAFSAEIVNIHNCHLLPTYFNGEMIWFFCLNLSFFFLFKYYVSRGLTTNPPAYSELAEESKVVDAESGTIEALYPQSTIETKQ